MFETWQRASSSFNLFLCQALGLGKERFMRLICKKFFEFICVFDLLDLVTVKIVGSGSFSGLLVVKYDFLLKIDCIRS